MKKTATLHEKILLTAKKSSTPPPTICQLQLLNYPIYILLFAFLTTSLSFGQTTVFQESFETGNSGTPSETCNDNENDFFTRTDGSDIDANYVVAGMDGTYFFAAQDTDGTPCTMGVETLTFTGINIAGYTDMTFAMQVAEDDARDAEEDWDADTFVLVEINIDGAGYTNVLQFSSGGATNTEPGLDTDFDGIADSTLLSFSFQEFTAAMGTGASADIRITFNLLNSGDEDIAIDNIRIIDGYVVSPTITVSAGLTGLNYVVSSGPSAGQTFTVEGSGLTNDISLSAPTDFEISETSGSGFGSGITLTQTGGTVATTTIYARLKSGLAVNSYSGDLDATSTGASSKTVSLSGDVFNPAANSLVLTAVFDGPLSGGTPKGVEIFVLKDIADLSLYGLGSANNGEGTDGQEFTFPADPATKGSYIYVASEGTEFLNFFGASPGYTDGSMGINGDDAVELYENGQVIDTYGVIDVNGDDEPWDYTDGWAYRMNDTGPDGSTYVQGNWSYSGIDALDGETTNDTAATPVPVGTYSNTLSTDGFNTNNFKVYPNPTSLGFVNISSNNNETIKATVFDVLGKQVINGTVINDKLDVSNLNTGVYIMRLTQNNATATKKLVIN